jgi:hypothetical protein
MVPLMGLSRGAKNSRSKKAAVLSPDAETGDAKAGTRQSINVRVTSRRFKN